MSTATRSRVAPAPKSADEVAGSTLSPRYSPSTTSSTPVVIHRQPSPSLGPVSPRIVKSIEVPPPINQLIHTNFHSRDGTPDDNSRESSPSDAATVSDKENSSPQSRAPPRYRFTFDRNPADGNPTLSEKAFGKRRAVDPGLQVSNPGTPAQGLKLRLRGVQAALRDYNENQSVNSPANLYAGRKRPTHETTADEDDETDSEIEIFASVRRAKKAAKLRRPTQGPQRRARPALVPCTTRQATRQSTARPSSKPPVEQLMQQSVQRAVHNPVQHPIQEELEEEQGEQVHVPEQKTSLITPALKRNARILDPNKPEHALLISKATKIGAEYYDSDAEEPAGEAKGTNKPELFCHVVWGSAANDYTNDADFPTEPEFAQFVPGRFELLPDGSVADQKAKLIIKLRDKNDKKRIFTNPPPRNWNSQEAITALNKRTVQQIRRNTNVRFREVVQAYVDVERQWILANLNAGKPTQGWKKFVTDFNARFAGQVLPGVVGPRPVRSHSSLTKEVERFGVEFYQQGAVPVLSRTTKKEKGVKK